MYVEQEVGRDDVAVPVRTVLFPEPQALPDEELNCLPTVHQTHHRGSSSFSELLVPAHLDQICQK